MKKRLLVAVLAGLFALLVPPALASADDLTLVTLDCGDGSPLQVTVDTNGLSDLQSAVQAMLDYPSGLTCTLSTSPVLSPLSLGTSTASAGSNPPYVVGGGRYLLGTDQSGNPCDANFAISAHVDSQGFHGTETFTIPATAACGVLANSHVKATVYCLTPSPTQTGVAEVDGNITEGTGAFQGATDNWVSDVTDGQPRPSPGSADQIVQTEESGNPCGPVSPGLYNLDNGNLSVGNGS